MIRKLDIDSVYLELLEIVSDFGADVDLPFFEQQARDFGGSPEDFVLHVRQQAASWFVSLGEPPSWIQNAAWPYFEGRPMCFVGQIEVPAPSARLHDNATFFVFWDRQAGVTDTVVQIG